MESWIPVVLALIGAPVLTFLGEFLSRAAHAKRISSLAEAAKVVDRPAALDAVAQLIAREAGSNTPTRLRFWRMATVIVGVWAVFVLFLLLAHLVFLDATSAVADVFSWGDFFQENYGPILGMAIVTFLAAGIWFFWPSLSALGKTSDDDAGAKEGSRR